MNKHKVLFENNEEAEEIKDNLEYNILIANKKKEMEESIKNAEELIESDMKLQKRRFQERRSGKRIDYCKKNTPALDNKRKTIFNFNAELLMNLEIDKKNCNGKSNSIIISNSEKAIKRKNILLKTLSNPNKKLTISDIFDQYFKKFHFLFFQTFCEKQISNSMKKYEEIYKKKRIFGMFGPKK